MRAVRNCGEPLDYGSHCRCEQKSGFWKRQTCNTAPGQSGSIALSVSLAPVTLLSSIGENHCSAPAVHLQRVESPEVAMRCSGPLNY